MATVKVSLPGARVPIGYVEDEDGKRKPVYGSTPWLQGWQAIFNRVGGSATDKVEVAAQSGATATTAAATANAAAATANAAAAAAQTAADDVTAAVATQQSLADLQVSGVDQDMTITSHDAGANVTVTMSAHTRYYGDGTSVAVSGGSLTGIPYDTDVYIWYDDASRAGGAVTYHYEVANGDAFPSLAHQNRHYVGVGRGILALDPDSSGFPNYWAF